MNKKLEQLLFLIKYDRKLFLRISFGIFLFILFFQPFPLDQFDFNNRLLIIAGLALIVFVIMALVRAAFIWLGQYENETIQEPIVLSYLGGFIILALTSLSFAFYLRFVGEVNITFYTMFKILLICLFPPVSLGLADEMKELKKQNDYLLSIKENYQKEVRKYEHDVFNKSIIFSSENGTDNLTVLLSNIVFIKSADNYIEIIYMESEILKKKLIRNTLKNIELQLKPYPNFIRCHRISIVNIHYIEKLNRKFDNYWLTIKGTDEQIPVSRQYLLKLKENI